MDKVDVQVFNLPRGMEGWSQVQDRIMWCEKTFGHREFCGPWEYNAVSHMMIIRESHNILLYTLKWT